MAPAAQACLQTCGSLSPSRRPTGQNEINLQELPEEDALFHSRKEALSSIGAVWSGEKWALGLCPPHPISRMFDGSWTCWCT